MKPRHLHILGICGTFMAGVAEIATRLGYKVTGSDSAIYPPMSTFLAEAGIEIFDGYEVAQLQPHPDIVLIGNALSRGNASVEYVLNEHIPYSSGAQWLAEEVLGTRHVFAIAGTHGKTTTTALLTWILQRNGRDPGFLIGGIAQDFERPAALGDGRFFVIEADEYDTAFFDKRSKFVHYRPDTLVINNVEFDHADIFPDLASIQRQFHHLVRTVPEKGTIYFPSGERSVDQIFDQGYWSNLVSFGGDTNAHWRIAPVDPANLEKFILHTPNGESHLVRSPLLGEHNARNVTAAIAAAGHAGITPGDAIAAVATFSGVKRRLEIVGTSDNVTIYDDFAHHPTAIRATLDAVRAKIGDARLTCILEPRSNTMRLGVHAAAIADALKAADKIALYADKDLAWDPKSILDTLGDRCEVFGDTEEIVNQVAARAQPGEHIVIMSNGGLAGIHHRLLDALIKRH